MSGGNYLTNQFLIAMPAMTDTNFSQTVTYIWEHDANGASGIVINRPLQMKLADVFEQLKFPTLSDTVGQQSVLLGGPVQTDRGFVLHHHGGDWEHTRQVSSRIQVTTSPDILKAMASGTGPGTAIVALGYAGWSSGQLESELAQNAWLTVPADERIMFETPYEQRWHAAARLLGVDLSTLSTSVGHA